MANTKKNPRNAQTINAAGKRQSEKRQQMIGNLQMNEGKAANVEGTRTASPSYGIRRGPTSGGEGDTYYNAGPARQGKRTLSPREQIANATTARGKAPKAKPRPAPKKPAAKPRGGKK